VELVNARLVTDPSAQKPDSRTPVLPTVTRTFVKIAVQPAGGVIEPGVPLWSVPKTTTSTSVLTVPVGLLTVVVAVVAGRSARLTELLTPIAIHPGASSGIGIGQIKAGHGNTLPGRDRGVVQ
jgi:hypothetical protein